MSDFSPPLLPPVFQCKFVPAGTSPYTAAIEQADADGEPGQFLVAMREDQVDCAVTLAPEGSRLDAYRIVYLAAVAIGDALGAIVPPAVEVQFGWPDRILVNGAIAGGVRLTVSSQNIEVAEDASHSDEPAWAVLGLTLQVAMDAMDISPGQDRERTSLHDEGCGELGTRDILESFSRHLLYWINKYQDEGFTPVRKHWLARTPGDSAAQVIQVAGQRYDITRLNIDDGGNVLVTSDGNALGFTVADALTEPTWTVKGSAG